MKLANGTLNRRCKQSPESVEVQFNEIRSDYLDELQKLRQKYAAKLAKLALTCNDVYFLEQQGVK